MIPVTVLTAGRGTVSYSIKGRFGRGRPSGFSGFYRPVVAWNLTYGCNLRCMHCYTDAGEPSRCELSTEEALEIVDQLASIKTPLVIFSG
jgi:MoaA/NifB/PqqE/SkfB family radical SAM enzyme